MNVSRMVSIPEEIHIGKCVVLGVESHARNQREAEVVSCQICEWDITE